MNVQYVLKGNNLLPRLQSRIYPQYIDNCKKENAKTVGGEK